MDFVFQCIQHFVSKEIIRDDGEFSCEKIQSDKENKGQTIEMLNGLYDQLMSLLYKSSKYSEISIIIEIEMAGRTVYLLK